MGYTLGVDLGTISTCAALLRDGRIEVVQLGGRRAEIPSVVFVAADGHVLVGDAAERRGVAEPSRIAREFKRRIGDPVSLLVGGAPYSAHALTGRLLASVLHTATEQQGGPPETVTITHPANWGPYKLELLWQAIRLAGLETADLLPEPEAAAVQFAAGERINTGGLVAVYDLGGGTFDAAVLRKTGIGFERLGSPEGIEQLGGIDFDAAVFDHVMSAVAGTRQAIDPDDADTMAALARLRRDCVEAKEALSFDTEVDIPVALPGLHTHVRLNRDELERMIRPSVVETIGAMHRALNSAGLPAAQLQTILLAGGSSRIPLVAQLLGAEFRRPTSMDPHPEHSVAVGAVRAATVRRAVVPPAAQQVTDGRSATGPGPTTVMAAGVGPPPEAAGRLPPGPSPTPAPAPTPTPGPETARSAALPPETRGQGDAVRREHRRTRLLVIIAAAVAAIVIIGVVIARPWEPAAVTGSATGTSPAGTPATTPAPTTLESVVVAPGEPCDFADEFTGQQVDPSWDQLQNPQPSVSNGEVRILAPDGADIFEDQQGAPMLLRVPTGDFTIETQVDADPRQLYQGAGLVLWNGVDQYVRLERGFGNTGAIAFEYRDGGPHTKVHAPVMEDPNLVQTDTTRVTLQLTKSADAVSARWRPADERQWQELGQIAIALPTSTQAGIAVLNRAQSGTVPEEFSAGFDYVHTSCD